MVKPFMNILEHASDTWSATVIVAITILLSASQRPVEYFISFRLWSTVSDQALV